MIVNEPAYAEGPQGVLSPQTAPLEEGNIIAADRGFQPASKHEDEPLGSVRNQHPVFNPIPTEHRIRTGRQGLRQLRKQRKVVPDRGRQRVVSCVLQESQLVAQNRRPARPFDRGKHRLRKGDIRHHARLDLDVPEPLGPEHPLPRSDIDPCRDMAEQLAVGVVGLLCRRSLAADAEKPRRAVLEEPDSGL